VIVYLRDQSGSRFEAQLRSDLDYSRTAAADREWTRVKRSFRLSPGAGLSESHEWNWQDKFLQRRDDHLFLAIECEGEIQGLLQLSTIPRPSHRERQSGAATLYIEHVETAPWNQALYSPSGLGRFRAVGYNLIAAVAAESAAFGCDESLSLHSLPDAEAFYREVPARGEKLFVEIGTGIEPYPDLRYF
jgi:hypothetical protein